MGGRGVVFSGPRLPVPGGQDAGETPPARRVGGWAVGRFGGLGGGSPKKGETGFQEEAPKVVEVSFCFFCSLVVWMLGGSPCLASKERT